MQHIITKFGGTSVSSRETWDNILDITQHHRSMGLQPIIICSALTQASNKLEQMTEAALFNRHQPVFDELMHDYHTLAHQLAVDTTLIHNEKQTLEQWLTGIALLGHAPAKTRAQILSVGELMMTRLGHAFLTQQGLSTLWFDARESLITTPVANLTEMNYLAARCDGLANPTLASRFLQSGVDAVITQGFIAANPEGETVLLGRGGSDTSAALFACILNAQSCEIWTDVPGIYTANPHQLPHARLLKQLNYQEAQEIASMGAKVLHPPCIPPVQKAGIPMVVKYTRMPEHSGTRITHDTDENAPPIKSIQVKHSITLISIDTLSMWQQVGFLADVFTTFKQHGFSVDLLSSSEFNVTLSLDSNIKWKSRQALDDLITALNPFGRAKIIEPCSAVSLVGHHIRMILHQLGPVLEIFEAKQIYLMALASNDLNLTFVVDESQADKLCHQLHAVLIENNPQSFYYSKSFQEQFGHPSTRQVPWWENQREALIKLANERSPCYVYDTATVVQKINELATLTSIDGLFYAVKANPHPALLRCLHENGVHFECVSIHELHHVFNTLPDLDKKRVLFTPNFAARTEYEKAIALGCHLTIDSLYPLAHWPEIFSGQSIILRLDPGSGAGHHKYVCTGGNESKFGIPKANINDAVTLTAQHAIHVVGLHAHSGSGILSLDLWQETALMLAEAASEFPNIQFINLGGGLGVVDKPGQVALDMDALNQSLHAVKSRYPHFAFWLEPGRFFVAECGVILTKVTQCKEKGRVRFIGVDTGMNSLIRPMLYGAYHEIVNLSRFLEDNIEFAHVVGPICESADTLGYDRLLPKTYEHDVILIANTGAYGHCMGSSYNMRPVAEEIVLEQHAT